MKLLWIVNIILPDVCKALHLPVNPYGGWLVGLSAQLKTYSDIDLHIVSVSNTHAGFSKEISGINYHIADNSAKAWQALRQQIQPDVVHIHGTEYDYGLQYIRANGADKVVFSIQGLVSVYERYYLAGLSTWDIVGNISFRDIVRADNLYQAQKKFKQRGNLEKEYFEKCQHVIGRTDWDKAHALAYNPNIKYYYGGEILREGFYVVEAWKYEDSIPHTIFLSQASYPIKGLHQVIKALPYLVKDYPNIKVKIAGQNILSNQSWKHRLKRGGYAKYISRLIRKLKLSEHIEFLGNLSEEAMIQEYRKANVFVCPSAIENSPNSLAEAQMVGVPVVASFVGGIPNMLSHGETGWLYRFEEVEMLAYYLKQVFDHPQALEEITTNSRKVARERHDTKTIAQQMNEVYLQFSNRTI